MTDDNHSSGWWHSTRGRCNLLNSTWAGVATPACRRLAHFVVSVLFCLTQEKTRSQCALLCGMVRMPSITLSRVWNGFAPPPFFLSLSAFHDRSILSRTRSSIVVHWYSANASISVRWTYWHQRREHLHKEHQIFRFSSRLQGDIRNLSSRQYLVMQR